MTRAGNVQQRDLSGALQREWRYRVEPQVSAQTKYVYKHDYYVRVEPGKVWWRACEQEVLPGRHWLLRWVPVERAGKLECQSFVTEAEAHEWCAQRVAQRAKELQGVLETERELQRLPPSTHYRLDRGELQRIAQAGEAGTPPAEPQEWVPATREELQQLVDDLTQELEPDHEGDVIMFADEVGYNALWERVQRAARK